MADVGQHVTVQCDVQGHQRSARVMLNERKYTVQMIIDDVPPEVGATMDDAQLIAICRSGLQLLQRGLHADCPMSVVLKMGAGPNPRWGHCATFRLLCQPHG